MCDSVREVDLLKKKKSGAKVKKKKKSLLENLIEW